MIRPNGNSIARLTHELKKARKNTRITGPMNGINDFTNFTPFLEFSLIAPAASLLSLAYSTVRIIPKVCATAKCALMRAAIAHGVRVHFRLRMT